LDYPEDRDRTNAASWQSFAEAQHQIALHDAAAHASVQKETQTSEHLSFGEVAQVPKNHPNPLCPSQVVGHIV
jgi:hypothetical protein